MKPLRCDLDQAAAALCVLVIAGASAAVQAGTLTLVAAEDVAICSQLVDLAEFRRRADAGNKDGLEVYLEGNQPPCRVVAKGERVDQLDLAGSEVQVVTRHGTPRFIGWGSRSAFRQEP